MNYTDTLRRLALNDAELTGDLIGGSGPTISELEPKTLALVRLAALVAVGGSQSSYGSHVDEAVSAGATEAEIVEVLVGVAPVLGVPLVVNAAPTLALALGYDTESALER